MKNLKSIKWNMSMIWFVAGIIVVCQGHPWLGIIIWAAAIRTTKEYYEEK